MLYRTRACSRSALGLVVFALGCTKSAPPPEAPLAESTESASAAPELMAEAESAPAAPAADATPDTAAPAAPTAAPGPSSHTPRDVRGKEQIQQVMAANREKVRACYDAALAHNPGIQGDLVLDFVIDPRGDVKLAEVNWSASDLHIPELDTCAVDAVRALKFPASSRGLESKVSYPFNFNPPRTDQPSKKTP